MSSSDRRRYALAGIVAGLILCFCGACAPGIDWRGFSFPAVHDEAERDQKLMFVYFRHWAVIECTDFEEKVLKAPAVLSATADLYCVPLDYRWDRSLADQWGVKAPPAVVIVDPAMKVLAQTEGVVPVSELLAAISSAREQFSPPPPSTAPGRPATSAFPTP